MRQKLMYSCVEWFYNNDISNKRRRSSEDKWNYYYNKLTRPPLDWKNECIETAKIIRDTTNLPIQIFVSGGVDSIVCCESFRLAGIPFEAITVDFKHNRYDIKYAEEYCNKFNIPQRIIDLDINDYFEKYMWNYVDICQNRNPQMIFQVWMADQVDDFPIFGLGEPFLCLGMSDELEFPGFKNPPINGGKVLSFEGEQYQAVEKYLRYYNRPGINKFFVYTTELKVSGMIEPIMIGWIKNAKKYGWQDTDSWANEIHSNCRNLLYLKHFPNIGIRPPMSYTRFKGKQKTIIRNDYTGFETISDLHRVYQDKLKDRHPIENVSFVPYIDKLKILCGEIMNIEHITKEIVEF